MTIGLGVGVVVNGGKNRIVQARTVRRDGWTEARREGFLLALSMTANVTTAAASVGITGSGAHALRRREPGFAALWGEALASGYDRLEEALLMAALAGLQTDPAGAGLENAGAGTGADERCKVGDGGGDGGGDESGMDGARAGKDRPAVAAIGTDIGGTDIGGTDIGMTGAEMRANGAPDALVLPGAMSGSGPGSGPGSGLGSGPGSGPGSGIVHLAGFQAVQVGLAMLARFRAAQTGARGKSPPHRRATVAETNASIAKKLDSLAQRLRASSVEGEV